MKEKNKQAWEPMDSSEGCLTYRLRVPGGWLYRTDSEEEVREGYLHTVRTMVFVPGAKEQKQELLTAPEAFVILQISRAHGYNLIKSGALKSVKIGRSRRISRADLDQFIHDLPSDGS
jgi:excisionase family DNA binding protein